MTTPNTKELRVLSTTFQDIGVVDVFDSLIWTDRYIGFGDFEITASPSANVINAANGGPYLTLEGSDHVMVIEDVNIDANTVDPFDKVIIKGRSLETILERRIIWNKTVLTGNLQVAIQSLLNENAISPTDPDRTITRLDFVASTDPLVTGLTVERQFGPDTSLYKAIEDLCIAAGIGFKITLTPLGRFLFTLYSGADRSTGNLANNTVVMFSTANDNLINSKYHASDTTLKTVTLIGGTGTPGPGEENVLITVVVEAPGPDGAGVDLARREMFTDASGVEKAVPLGNMSTTTYISQSTGLATLYEDQLEQLGIEDLAKNVMIETFEGELNPNITGFIYGIDYFMGDIVQTQDDYNHSGKSQVTELIHSEDLEAFKTYPTFTTVIS